MRRNRLWQNHVFNTDIFLDWKYLVKSLAMLLWNDKIFNNAALSQ